MTADYYRWLYAGESQLGVSYWVAYFTSVGEVPGSIPGVMRILPRICAVGVTVEGRRLVETTTQ